jgi:hypothetical protein
MADEPTTPQGNDPQARAPTGELKDQNPTLTQPSGQTNTDPSPKPEQNERSFLNREPDVKASDEKASGKEGEPKPEAKPEGAPEKYADFKLPDGYTFDPEALKEVTGLFKEAGLSQDSAQKLVDYYAKNSLQASEAPYKLWADTQREWVKDIENSFGSKAEAMRKDINQFIDSPALTPKLRTAFREALDFTGAGSNPAVFEALSILVKPFLEGSSVPQGRPSAQGQQAPKADSRPSLAEAMYPHLIPNRGA